MPMLSARLKEETKEAHQSLEAIVVRRIKSIRSHDQYAQLLHKFYGYHFPMEMAFDRYFTDEIIPHYTDRRKSDLILKDLDNLGMKQSISLATEIPDLNNMQRAFGAYYVLEGSTQGGDIVAGMLIKHAGLTPETTSFFNVYGEKKKEMWQSFKKKLDYFFEDGGKGDEVVAAANETFTRFEAWMR
jgi:heme oxygenase (biliverdin-IX-beta and delta-forming)